MNQYVRTSDGVKFKVDQGFVNECSKLKMATIMLDCSDEHAFFEVPLVNIDSLLMETIQRFFTSNSIPEFQELSPILLAAEHLGYEKLVHRLRASDLVNPK
jgi:hypothetical protein